MVSIQTGRILKAMQVIKDLDNAYYSEKNLRGLSPLEKEFIRDNNYKLHLIQSDKKEFYMFIGCDLLGKKRLYALSKKQSMFPNGKDISSEAYNYECWLLFNPINWGFSTYFYERRFCKTPPIKMIYA